VEVEVRYDGRAHTLRVPACEFTQAGRASVAPRPDRSAPAREALKPLLDRCERLLVVVNDAYRPTPTATMLAALAPLLHGAGECRVLVATGMHPAPGRADVERLVGDAASSFECFVHRAEAPGELWDTFEDGAPLELNPLVRWADRILLLGSVEPHFFAGFTGGAKQLLPGVATRRAIEANHRHATHDNCRPCRVADNPVAAPIRKTARLMGERLASCQAVAAPGGWEYFAGSEMPTFEAATARCVETSRVTFPRSLDLLIAVVDEPLDRNLYQLQKGFENHQWVVRDGGALVLVSACREGVGNDFFSALADRYPDWRALPRWEDQSYSLGLHKLYRTARTRARIDLFLWSTLPEDVVRKFYLEPVCDLDSWLAGRVTPGMHVGLVRDAAHTVSEVVH
jgi:nickel-dependent lactate racemase